MFTVECSISPTRVLELITSSVTPVPAFYGLWCYIVQLGIERGRD
jgi:hypothetical protein